MSASRTRIRAAREAGHAPAGGLHRTSGADRTPEAARLTPTQSMILHLQRTAGNAAVNALLRQTNHGQPVPEARTTGSPNPVVQRLMSFNDFQKATRQLETRKRGGIRGVFGGKKTVTDEGKQAILSGAWNSFDTVNSDGLNINEAYKKYEADKSLPSLIALYDTITFWETLHAHFKKEAGELGPVLHVIKEQIAAEVQAETKRQSGGQTTAVDNLLKPAGKAAPTTEMEPFLKDVGVPLGYYEEHLAGNPQRIAALEDFYTNLKEGHVYNASQAYKQVSAVEGMYLIKPLFLSRFPNKAHLRGMVGTKAASTESNELTEEEFEAIEAYSGGNYIDINKQLRGHSMRSAKAVMGKARMNAADKKAANDAYNVQSTLELAISGLNKLPKFQGMAYRVSLKVPPGYFSAVRPGGMMADLAFSSASPSMTGVGNYSHLMPGTKNLYYIIHTKTAVNIVRMALGPAEGEVLFRPGTRFQVEAVWEHKNGKVPTAAPAAAQMVLHTMGDVKTEKGHTKPAWEDAKYHMSAFTPPEDVAKEFAPTFEDEKLNKVKVIEMTEV